VKYRFIFFGVGDQNKLFDTSFKSIVNVYKAYPNALILLVTTVLICTSHSALVTHSKLSVLWRGVWTDIWRHL